MSTRARRSFPVGRRRHVPVVDSGCGCRPRRPRLLSLPSFFLTRSSSSGTAGKGAAPARSASAHSSSSTASSSYYSSSASSAATYATTQSFGSCYSTHYYSHGGAPAAAKQPEAGGAAAAKKKKKKRYVVERASPAVKEKASPAAKGKEEGEEGVGVAVEKESSDPRADFRESMVAMVVEMEICDWDDLRCMLRRLLALNAPRHHAAILTAFAEVCAQLAAPPPPPPYRR